MINKMEFSLGEKLFQDYYLNLFVTHSLLYILKSLKLCILLKNLMKLVLTLGHDFFSFLFGIDLILSCPFSAGHPLVKKQMEF